MGKPMFWRTCGWGWLLSVGLFIFGALYDHAQGVDAATQPWMMLVFLGLVTLLPLWAIGTLVHRSRVHRARIQAAAYQEIQPRGHWVQVPPAPPAPPSAAPEQPKPATSKARTGPLGL